MRIRQRWARWLVTWLLGSGAIAGAALPILADSASLTLGATVAPTPVHTGQRVTYTIALENRGASPAYDLSLVHTLPTGFTYVPGSSELLLNQTVVSRPEPSRSGTVLTWSGMQAPAARSAGFFGMHTFVQDRCERAYINGQLDRVRELMGSNAYVKQLLYPITAGTGGPQSCWVDFVNGCYDRDLIPVVRLAGQHGGDFWLKPPANAPGDYTSIAQAFARVVNGLPRRAGRLLYVEIWNEPNLDIEWSGQANPTEYANLLVDAAAALRALGDTRIVILNGGLSPGGNYNNLNFIDAMADVPGALQAFDVWSAHPYPGNHPPEYNIHDNTAPIYPELTIDSYLLELNRLASNGRSGAKVLLTETGYALGQNNFGFQGYAPIEEANRADYISRAFHDHWSRWPEILGVCPYELVDPFGNWAVWDWLQPNGARHQQYDAVRALDKTPPMAPGALMLRFSATVSNTPGTYASQVQARSSNAGQVTLANAAPVQVLAPAATATPTRTATPSRTPSPTPPLTCNEVIGNGGFEETSAWEIPETAYRAAYSTDRAYSGQRSMRVGIASGAPVLSYSAARQAILVPDWATTLRITYRYYAVSTAVSHGRQYALLLDANKTYIETVMWLNTNDARWQQHTFETSGHAGQTLWLQLGAYNDGVEGLTAMYVDDVSVMVCGPQGSVTLTPTVTPSVTASGQPTHTPTPTSTRTPGPSVTTPAPSATPTPTTSPTGSPSVCQEQVVNGGFEQDAGWTFPQTTYPGRYSAQRARSGARAALLGILDPGANVYSYSSADQLLALPVDKALTLTYWYYPSAGELLADRQYLLLLDAQGAYTTLMWELGDAQSWQQHSVDLSAYAGQQVTLRFGVFNDGAGGVAAMVVDDVSLLACDKFASTPTPTPSPTLTPTVTLTPTPVNTLTPMPAEPVYVERTLAVGQEPRGVAVDSRTGLVYVANYAGADLSVVNPDRGQVVATIPLPGAAGCHGVAVDVARRRAYVANSESRSLSVVDLNAGVQLGLVSLSAAPQDVAVDPADGRAYVSLPDAASVAVVDAASLTQVLTLTVGTAPSGLLVDGAERRLIVANRHPLFNSLGLYALPDGASLDTWPVGAEPNAVARDPHTGTLFSADTVGRSVTMLSAQGDLVRSISLPDAVLQVAYNQRSRRIMALCPATQSLHVLAADSGATLLTQPVGQGSGAGLAVDQATGRIYVTNSAEDTLSILRDQGGEPGPWLPLALKGLPVQLQARVQAETLAEPDQAMPQQQTGVHSMLLLLEGDAAQQRTLAADGIRRRLAVSAGARVSLMEATEGRPLAEWRLPEQVAAMLFSEDTGRLYVALAERGELYALAPGQAPRLVAAELGRPTSLAWGGGRLYLTDLAGRRVVVIAPDGGIMASSVEPAAPHGLALDVLRRRLYVGDVSSGAVLALDADTLQPLGRVALGGLGLPNGLALSADGERLYVSHALSPKYGALTLIDPLVLEPQITLWGNPAQPLWGASAVAVDAQGGVLLGTARDVLRLDGHDLALRGRFGERLLAGSGSLVMMPQDEIVFGIDDVGRLWRR